MLSSMIENTLRNYISSHLPPVVPSVILFPQKNKHRILDSVDIYTEGCCFSEQTKCPKSGN